MSNEIPSLEQIKRLEKLQGVDFGVFTLAVFSVFEAHFKDKLNVGSKSELNFNELADNYRRKFSVRDPKEYSLFKDIKFNKINTNLVRHSFKNLTEQEATGAVKLLNDFAKIFNIPNKLEISKLASLSKIWDERKNPVEKELEKVNEKLKALSKSNTDLAEKVLDYEKNQRKLELLTSELKTLQLKYEIETERNKNSKTRIDELRSKNFAAETENKKAQKEIQEQLEKIKSEQEKLNAAQEYISNLSRMTTYTRTRYDYEKNLVHLTREQESIVNIVNFESDFLIKGSAGTGKSLVLLKTLEKLLKKNQENDLFGSNKKTVKLLTYTHSLEKYNRYVASLMSGGIVNGKVSNEIILTLDSFLSKILKSAFGKRFEYPIDKKMIEKGSLLDDEIKQNPLGNEIWTEIEKFILPNCVTKSEYCDNMIPRTGMKKPLNEESRKKVWNVAEQIFKKFEKSDVFSFDFAFYLLALKIDSGEYKIPDELKTDYLFIDEAQDLTAAKIRILKAAANKNLIFAGDNDQSVFQTGFSWSRAKINISGHTKILNTNFRSTNQINDVAEKYRRLIKGADKENSPETFRLGPPVELHESKNKEEAFSQIIKTVRMCQSSLGYESENICIIAESNKPNEILKEIKSLLKSELDLDADFVNSKDFDFAKTGIVRLATTQSCKGLDFPVVLFYADHHNPIFDSMGSEISEKMNRNMIYTALTRSIELLHVFMSETVSEGPLSDLKMILKEA